MDIIIPKNLQGQTGTVGNAIEQTGEEMSRVGQNAGWFIDNIQKNYDYNDAVKLTNDLELELQQYHVESLQKDDGSNPKAFEEYQQGKQKIIEKIRTKANKYNGRVLGYVDKHTQVRSAEYDGNAQRAFYGNMIKKSIATDKEEAQNSIDAALRLDTGEPFENIQDAIFQNYTKIKSREGIYGANWQEVFKGSMSQAILNTFNVGLEDPEQSRKIITMMKDPEVNAEIMEYLTPEARVHVQKMLQKAGEDATESQMYAEIYAANTTIQGLNYAQAQKDALDPNKYKDVPLETRQKVFTILAHGETAEKETVRRQSDDLTVKMLKMYNERKLSYKAIDELATSLPEQYRASFTKEGYRYFDMQVRLDRAQSHDDAASDDQFREIVAQELKEPGSITLEQINDAMEKGLKPAVALQFSQNKNLLYTQEFRTKLDDLKALRNKKWFSADPEKNIHRFEAAQATMYDLYSKGTKSGVELDDAYKKVLDAAKPNFMVDIVNFVKNPFGSNVPEKANLLSEGQGIEKLTPEEQELKRRGYKKVNGKWTK